MMYWLFPVVLTSMGALIHLVALLGVSIGDAPSWLHITMLIVDAVVVMGLLIRSKWGHGLAIILYLQQVFGQTYWAVEIFRNDWDMLWLQVVTAFLCAMSLIILIFRRKLFVA